MYNTFSENNLLVVMFPQVHLSTWNKISKQMQHANFAEVPSIQAQLQNLLIH